MHFRKTNSNLTQSLCNLFRRLDLFDREILGLSVLADGTATDEAKELLDTFAIQVKNLISLAKLKFIKNIRHNEGN